MPIVNGEIVVAGIYGISIDDVAAALPSSSRNMGSLCTSPLVKVKSLHKPIRLDRWHGSGPYGEPTQEQRRSVNFGHTYNKGKNPFEVLRLWADQAAFFPYNPPTAKYRIQDFNGYELQPNNWFFLTTKNGAVSQTTAKVLWALNYEDLFERIQQLYDVVGRSDAYNFGFLMYQGASLGAALSWYQVTDIRSATQVLSMMLEDEKIPMQIAGKVAAGSWTVIPAFYTANDLGGASSVSTLRDEEYSGDWLLFPFCDAAALTVTGGGGPEPTDVELLSKIDYEVRAFTDLVDAVNLVYEIRRLDLVCTNNNDRAFNLYITSATIGRITGSGLLAQALSVPMQAGEEVSVTLSQAAEGEQGFRFVLESYEGDILPLQLLVRRFGTTSGDIAANPDYDISQKYPFIEK